MEYSERVVGCLLGGTVGDALGAAVEFDSLARIRAKFGPRGIESYAPAYGRLGAITDDTQMTLFTLEGLLQSRAGRGNGTSYPDFGLHSYMRWLGTQGTKSKDPKLAHVYSGWLWQQKPLHSRRAPGNSCLSSLSYRLRAMEHGSQGIPREPINDSKGCGGVMRMAPVGFFDIDCFQTGCELAMITHGHPSGYLASGYLAHLIHELMAGSSLPDAIASATEALKQRPFHEEVLQAVERAVRLAESEAATAEVVGKMGEGWVAEEALAISLFCALKAESFAHGIRLAVNHGGDSDSTGAITGNILGAMWGVGAIPEEFLRDLEMKDVIEQMARDTVCSVCDGATLAGMAQPSAAEFPAELQPTPFPRSYWVSPGQLLAGFYPGDKDPVEARKKLNAMLDVGIRIIVNLMEEDETDSSGNPFARYDGQFGILASERGLKVICIRTPIEDCDVTSKKFMSEILDHIDRSIAAHLPVYVHCWGGLGRTGTVVGCWLSRHGIAQGEAALEQIKHLRCNEAKADSPSPQTRAQCEFVRDWNSGR